MSLAVNRLSLGLILLFRFSLYSAHMADIFTHSHIEGGALIDICMLEILQEPFSMHTLYSLADIKYPRIYKTEYLIVPVKDEYNPF